MLSFPVDALISPNPRADLPGAAVFAPLIGSWDLVVTDVADDGSSSDRDGEWHFAWALDGRAVVDVWISPSRATRGDNGDGEWGMSVRFPDPVSGRWRSTWHGPGRGWLIPFEAAVDGGSPVLTSELDGVTRRWIFSDVTPTGFAWRAEESVDGGPFRVRQRFVATRPARANSGQGGHPMG
jgi:hypothetical protein